MKRLVGAFVMVALGGTIALGQSTRAAADRREAATKERQYAVCHETASDTHPYNLIIVDESAVSTHIDGHGQNNRPDYVREGPLSAAREAFYRKAGDSACGSSPPG